MKPEWLKVKQPEEQGFVADLLGRKSIHTVCEEAACPNIGNCWRRKHAAFIIMGDVCTRGCKFCNIKSGIPGKLDVNEPTRIAEATRDMCLRHVVITSVTRDDLSDGGASHFVKVISEIRRLSTDTTIEVLTPDFRGKAGALELVVNAHPDVFNHNIETVSRFYNNVRVGANYFGSLRLLSRVKELDSSIVTKSGMMLGLGETDREIYNTMDDLREAGVEFLTIGQYLAPTKDHYPVERYVTPEQFEHYKKVAESKGFLMVASSPLTRSSFNADYDFEKIKSLYRG